MEWITRYNRERTDKNLDYTIGDEKGKRAREPVYKGCITTFILGIFCLKLIFA